ncbi:MAG: hypothetical protein MUC43_16510 [Pirellula sp.]|jgi:hypothetical protein|nr:hypothetical protein [Pirellula sp.]
MRNALLLVMVAGLFSVGCKPEEDRERDRLARENEAAASAEPTLQEPKIAGVGVGKQSQGMGDVSSANPANFVAAPAKAYFQIKERIVFEQLIPKVMQLYQATNGHLPKTHEAYMKELEVNLIKLPELPPGQVYRYRPEEGELYVEPSAPKQGS